MRGGEGEGERVAKKTIKYIGNKTSDSKIVKLSLVVALQR